MTADAAVEDLDDQDVRPLIDLISRCVEQQPTLRLLDPGGAVELVDVEDGRYLVVLDGHQGFVDAGTTRFVPLAEGPLRMLLVQKLQGEHGDTEFEADGRSLRVNWPTLRIESEGEGLVTVVVDSLPEDDEVQELTLAVDGAWQVTVTAVQASAADLTAKLRTELSEAVEAILAEGAPAAGLAASARSGLAAALTPYVDDYLTRNPDVEAWYRAALTEVAPAAIEADDGPEDEPDPRGQRITALALERVTAERPALAARVPADQLELIAAETVDLALQQEEVDAA